MKKCVFFDRDGIVNVAPGPGYVLNWSGFKLMPGFANILRAVRAKGYEAVVITNQQGVARGLMSMEALNEIHENMQAELRGKYGLELTDVFTCTHAAAENCACRKPKPGMFHMAAEKHHIDLQSSWMVGDNERDIEAGRAAGCRTILVSAELAGTAADYKVRDLPELDSLIAKAL